MFGRVFGVFRGGFLGVKIQKTVRKTLKYLLWLSDIHFGTKGCQAERLLDFLYNHSCEELYLVGDIVDGWRMEQSLFWPQAHTNVLRRFLSYAKNDTNVNYITGNHDEFLRAYSPIEYTFVCLE